MDPRVRRYRRLVGGYAVSSYGSYLDTIALNLFVYTLSRSALVMGLFMAVRLASGLVAGLTAGGLIARYRPRRVMVWSPVVQAGALVLLLAAPERLRTGAVFLLALLAGAAGTLFLVAFRSSVPRMVGPDRRGWANSLMVSGRSLAMVAGFASAGLVVSMLGYRAAFLIDMATFVVCALVVASLPAGAGDAPAAPGAPVPAAGRPARAGAAIAALRATPTLLMMVCLRAVDAFGSSSHNVALPVYSTMLDPHHAAAFVSRFLFCWGLGNILVQQVVQVWTGRTGRVVGARGFGVGTVLMSVAFVAAFAGLPVAATVAVALAAGMADGLTEVSYTSHLQTLPDAVRGHAFGFSATAENLGFGVGMMTVAGLLERFTPLAVVGAAHGVAVLVALGYLAVVARGTAGGAERAGFGARAGGGRGRRGAAPGGVAVGDRREGAGLPGH